MFWVKLTLAFSWLIACMFLAGAVAPTLVPESIPGALFVVASFVAAMAPLYLLIQATTRVRNKITSATPSGPTLMTWEEFEVTHEQELKELSRLCETLAPLYHTGLSSSPRAR
ncbi:MAG TPA: hypothetical protein VFH06_03805 [Candidatus Saccharimonadales bacterium]|nr:hypothetical protein [Candidatus Saccharimonadales bacterium]